MSYRHASFSLLSHHMVSAAWSTVVLAAFLFCTLYPAHAAEGAKAAKTARRHIIIGFDTSSSMGASRKRAAVQRLPQLLTEILYVRIPRHIVPPDRGFPQINENSDLDFNSGLYRPGDIMTFFTFDAQNRYSFARRKGYIPRNVFAELLPRSYKGKWSLLRCAEAEAFQNFQVHDDETFFIRITDEEEDLDIEEKEIYRDCVGRRIVYEADHSMKPKYAIVAGGKIFLTVYKIEGQVGPYPFFLVDSQRDNTRVESLTFTREGDRARVRKGYDIVINPKLKKTYTIREMRMVVRSSDRGTVEFQKMLTMDKRQPPFNLNFDVDPKYLSKEYALDLDITFDRNPENQKGGPKLDDFSIRNIALSAEARSMSPPSSVAQADPFQIGRTTINLESRGENYYGGFVPITLKPDAQSGALRIDKITLSGRGFNYPLTSSSSDNFPSAVKIEFPAKDFPEEGNVPAVLSIHSSAANGQLLLPQRFNITLLSKPPSFQVKCGNSRGSTLNFEVRDGKAGLWDCRLVFPATLKSKLRTVQASLKLPGTTFTLGSFGPDDAEKPIGRELPRADWKRLSVEQAFSATLSFDYVLTSSDRTFHADLPVDVVIPEFHDLPSNPFIVTGTAESTAPVNAIAARWTDKGIALPDLFIKLGPNLTGEEAGLMKPLKYETTGICPRAGEIGSLPFKISVVPTPQEMATLATGAGNLILTIRFSSSDSREEMVQTQPIAINLPKPPPPSFVVVSNQGDVNPVSEVRLRRDGEVYKPDGLYLKLVKRVGLGKIEAVEYFVGGKNAGRWNNPVLTQDTVPLPITFPEAPREQVPTSLKVTYSQVGSSEPLSTTINGPTILPISWLWRRDYVGFIPNLLLALLGLLLALVAAFVGYILSQRKNPASQPKRFQVRSPGIQLWDEENVSPTFELKPGETIGFAFEPQWTKTWDELNCPGWFIEYGKEEKALVLRNVAAPTRTQMRDFTEYEITDGIGNTRKISVCPQTARRTTAS